MEAIKQELKKLPHTPGVYVFKNAAGSVLYVGKAVHLSRRVRSYFTKDVHDPKTEQLVQSVDRIQTIQTVSEFDAILLEARLIHALQPKYNVIARDDKSPLYIRITLGEELPRVTLIRKPMDDGGRTKPTYIGPFQSSRIVRTLLRQLRTVTPFCTQKRRNGYACFYTHLGLCTPCPSRIAKLPDSDERKKLVTEYRKNIFRLRDILIGKSVKVRAAITGNMRTFARERKFESAAVLRDHLRALDSLLTRHYDPSLYLTVPLKGGGIVGSELTDLHTILRPYYPDSSYPQRIECYDISHLGGYGATGSMVVATGGIIDPSQYRRFRVRLPSQNDLSMIDEVVTRRFKHADWPEPDFVVIDGGKPQVGQARITLKRSHRSIAVIGIAKQFEDIIVPQNGAYRTIRLPLDSPSLQLIQRLRDEAHRYAVLYQRWISRMKKSGVPV